MYKFAAGFAWMAITFWSCTDNPGITGLDLLPHSDLISVNRVVETNIKAFNVTDEKLRTDEVPYNLLGTFNDPIFGKTTTDFASQYRLMSFPKFKENDIIDSLVLVMAYKEIYGDILTPQKLKVYELATDLSIDTKYYQDIDMGSISKSEILAEYNYVPKFKLDSLTTATLSKSDPKDTVTQEISIQLNHSLAQKLMKADSLTLSSNDLFVKYFKGLYVEAGDLNQGGTIMKLLGSGVVLYYRKANDTTKYVCNFKTNTNAAKVSHFTHNYSSTNFSANLNSTDKQDSLLYIQSTGGLRSKILIPNLGSWTKLIPNLANPADTANFMINKAELIFQVDSTTSQLDKYAPPAKLILAAIGKSKANQDSIYFPSDYTFSSTYFGGNYYSKDKTYRFNIAKQMQDVIGKKKNNNGFYLETALKNEVFRRVVLKGATSKTGIRLEITYSKIR